MNVENKQKLKIHRKPSSALRKKLLEKYNHACVSCGIKNEDIPLEIAHIFPLVSGGETTEDNLILLCPNCHRTFDRQPREQEFVSFLAELLKLHPDFSDIQQEPLLGSVTRYRADILVQSQSRSISEKLLIECKSHRILTSTHINKVIAQLNNYKDVYGDCRLILAVPATLKARDIYDLRVANVELWDLNYIANHFSKQINEANPSYFKAFFLAQILRSTKTTREQELLNSLSACKRGKTDWHVYQSLVGDILEHLFTPPLGKPIPELSDRVKANRRDFIMPNYVDKGFWAFIRGKYGADYIVIDAKNYTRKVKKSEVLQVANYLKPHGAGLFGMIFSRIGGDSSGCEHTLREQWLVHQKVILVLDDDDVKEMLIARSDGRAPEDILSQKIERFRLSM